MKNLQVFKNELFEVALKLESGETLFDAERVARSLGFTEIKNGKEYIRWRTVNGYLKFSQDVAKGDFIPESAVYKLAFKASNEIAEKFQDWLALEVLPSIRKHGMYAANELLDNPDLLIQIATQLKEERLKRIEVEKVNEINKPKVIFADAITTSHSSILVGELAKLIKQNGVDIGEKRLFEWLRKNGFLINRKGTDYNMPTQKSMDLELFQIKERPIVHSDGHITVSKTPKVTGKGQVYFINKFKNLVEAKENEIRRISEISFN